jgi:beta-lysine 5,6-aminomutase beta subunit
MPDVVDLSAVKPYADHRGDGLVQMSFTLPVPYSLAARRAALELAAKMGFEEPEVVHYEELTEGYTYFVMFGRCTQAVDFGALQGEGFDIEYMSEDEIEAFAREHLGRPIVVVGASTGSDTHSVGIDAMLNLKGYHGHHGLEGYHSFETYNLGSQVPNSVLLAKAIDVGADAILVSQTVTQQNLHVHNLTELVEMVEAEGVRADMILACGGPRVSNELAKELGYDAGFSKGTEPHHLATFIVRELAARVSASG